MKYMIFTVYDRLTNVYEPIFEARTIELVRKELKDMCSRTARSPSSYEIVHIGNVYREDSKDGFMKINIESFEEDVVGDNRYEVEVDNG